MITKAKLDELFSKFKPNHPFDFGYVDDFIEEPLISDLEKEFLPYDSPKWFVYKNAIEDKKALNDWNVFPPATYRFFYYLNSPEFVSLLSDYMGVQLFPDPGLNGGGWHSHGPGGNLNPHLDYSLHPKLGLERKLNIIIYISRELEESHGGHLGLWEQDAATKRPGRLAQEIRPLFNRAVAFDTTQNSWHGMSRGLSQPEGIYRKSLAIYYLGKPNANTTDRGKALFAPREEQKGDQSVEDLIKLRSNVATSQQVYNKTRT